MSPFDFLPVLAQHGPAVEGAGSWPLLIFYLCLAIGFSFLCSVAEAVLLSVTPSYIAQLRDREARGAETLTRLKKNVDRPLAAILSLNTIAHTFGAAGVGAEAAAIFGDAYVAAISAILTLMILVLSEIIPKTIGATYWRALAPTMGTFVSWLIWAMYPLVLLSDGLAKLISPQGTHGVVTREEIAAMATLGAQSGNLEKSESRIFANLLRFRELTVADVMTPRTVVIAFPQDLTAEELFERNPEIPVSRLPIYKDKLDEVTGFVHRNDLLLARARGEGGKRLSEFRRDLTTVRDEATLTELSDLLLGGGSHIAAVTDRFGGLDGVVTLEDLIETLLGLEIVDEHDAAPDMQKLARRKWEQRAKRLGIVLPDDAPARAAAAPGKPTVEDSSARQSSPEDSLAEDALVEP
ncbi:CNNM domain-containing protein [Alienimonas californiensis]|uniref:Hemolysin C n=1 Tax=Alienimonas californiensis TaxID=2527989 RepID=A0A517P502_9PLAN|nr:CNNM domain-containing protein [Alienimonas californiensis]QDT14460.1 Hemolysin C [Alienimonas californiensis]